MEDLVYGHKIKGPAIIIDRNRWLFIFIIGIAIFVPLSKIFYLIQMLKPELSNIIRSTCYCPSFIWFYQQIMRI